MNDMFIKIASVITATLACPLTAQVGNPDDSILFEEQFFVGSQYVSFEIASNGNLFGFPFITGPESDPGFTTVLRTSESTQDIYTEIFPTDVFGNNSSVAFAGADTFLYFNDAYLNSQGIRTGVVITYEVTQAGGLNELDRICPPSTYDVIGTTSRNPIDAEQDQFVISLYMEGEDLYSKTCIYRKGSNGWSLDGTITRDDRKVSSLAIEGDVLVICYQNDRVELHERDTGGSWNFAVELLPFDSTGFVNIQTPEHFGAQCDMQNGMIVVSDTTINVFDPTIGVGGLDQSSGACFVYSYSSGVLSELAVLFEHDGTELGQGESRGYGESIDLSSDGEYLVVGAPYFDFAPGLYQTSGATFLYETNDFSVSPVKYFDSQRANDCSGGGERYGQSVRLSGGTLAIFTSEYIENMDPNCESLGNDEQALLLYTDAISSTACNAADLADEIGVLNFLDVSAFLLAFGNMDPLADLNSDSSFNFLDVSAFLTLYGQGCP